MRLVAPFLLSVAFGISILPGSFAGPACARRYCNTEGCIAKCQSKWGWPGSAMGTDPWGAVMTPASGSISDVVSQACRNRSSTSIAPSTPVATQPVVAVPSQITQSSSSSDLSLSISSSVFTTITQSAKPTVNEAPVQPSSISQNPPSSAVPPPKTSAKPSPASTPPPAPSTSSPSPAPSPSSSSPLVSVSSSGGSSDSGGSSTSSSDEQQYLSAHNSFRAQHGAAPLTWSDNLASKAQEWANNCKFQHSGGTLGPFGENLAAGTGDSYDIAAAIKSWTDESSQYDPTNPVPSHFTQVVWKGSTQLGCAEAQCSGIFSSSFGLAKFFVCEYSPQGNVIGEFGQNVQA